MVRGCAVLVFGFWFLGLWRFVTIGAPYPNRASVAISADTALQRRLHLSRAANDLLFWHAAMQKCWASPVASGSRVANKHHRMCNGSLNCRRGIQDVAITRTGKPVIRIQGGR